MLLRNKKKIDKKKRKEVEMPKSKKTSNSVSTSRVDTLGESVCRYMDDGQGQKNEEIMKYEINWQYPYSHYFPPFSSIFPAVSFSFCLSISALLVLGPLYEGITTSFGRKQGTALMARPLLMAPK